MYITNGIVRVSRGWHVIMSCPCVTCHGVSCLAPRQYSNPSQITPRCYKLYLEAATLQSISRAKMLEISPWNFILVLLRISGCESHKCDVDIRMALQSDLIKAVFILRRPGHFILWPTFNFKLKPLLARTMAPAEDVSLCPGWQNVYRGTSFNT